MKTFDNKVRLFIYDHFVTAGGAPTLAETANFLAKSLADIKASFERLVEGHALVLQDGSGEILMAEPFSAVPTAFHVEVEDRSWWANCAWDALGIPAMLKKDASIVASCGDCNDPMVVAVKDGSLVDNSGVVHILVPAKHWWDDIVFS
jgi:hypothetical protein